MYTPDYAAIDIARQRRQEAEAAAAHHRLVRQITTVNPLRIQLGHALIRMGRRLTTVPSPAPSTWDGSVGRIVVG